MQSAKNIFLVKPSRFVYNDQTSGSNAFQKKSSAQDNDKVTIDAIKEFKLFADTLRAKGVGVFEFNDTPTPIKPDAIFPNNWISFHADGTVILYPMQAENRRSERRPDIMEALKKDFHITKIIDLSPYEKENKFLEGTGSIVFDHAHKIAYACLSPRTDKELFIRIAEMLGYSALHFTAQDEKGKDIYHTNVMMSVSDKFAVVCLNSIMNRQEREAVINSLRNTGHSIIDITSEQINSFAGNMLSVRSEDNKNLTILSQTAFNCLTPIQKIEIEKHSELVPIPIPTIETIGGGSARCMMAEIFLQPEK